MRAMGSEANRSAVVVLNMGGPGALPEVERYIFRLLSDPAMVRVPLGSFWWRPLARRIAARRAPGVIERYRMVGGASPVGPETASIAEYLSRELGIPIHLAMRYTEPGADDAVRRLVDAGVRRVILLPLYPQYSTVTTAPALSEMQARIPPGIAVKTIPSHHRMPEFIQALAHGIDEALAACDEERVHLMFTAHSLPARYVAAGDPYVTQVRETAGAVVRALRHAVSWSLGFQSRVGPARWQGPATDAVLQELSNVDTLLVQPVSFSTENLETLYDLDIDLRKKCREKGLRRMIRLPAPGKSLEYREGLKKLIMKTMEAFP